MILRKDSGHAFLSILLALDVDGISGMFGLAVLIFDRPERNLEIANSPVGTGRNRPHFLVPLSLIERLP